jgi:hypothetical protein
VSARTAAETRHEGAAVGETTNWRLKLGPMLGDFASARGIEGR